MILSRVVVSCGTAMMLWVAGLSAQSDAEQLRAIEHQRLQALVDADMDVARRLHADDFQLITPTGGTVSKEEYLGLIASSEVDYVEWEPDAIDVRLYTDVAVLRYRAQLRVVVQGQPNAPTGRFWHTDVYERRDGQWQVVWSQATAIQ